MKNHDGAALLVVLSLLGLTSVLVIHSWFITSLQYDIVLQREIWHKNFYATEMMLNLGLVEVSRNFEVYAQRVNLSKEPVPINLTRIFKKAKDDPSGSVGHVFVEKCNNHEQKGALIVGAIRRENNVCTCQLRCLLKKVLHANNDKEIQFVASHFTIGSGL